MSELKLPVGPNIVYKIRRKSDGLFSMGGSTPSFNKKGKIWKQRGHLTSHINQLWNNGRSMRYGNDATNHVYADCEVVPYEITETPTGSTQTIMTYIAERKAEKEEVNRKAVIAREASDKELRRNRYETLKQEFE